MMAFAGLREAFAAAVSEAQEKTQTELNTGGVEEEALDDSFSVHSKFSQNSEFRVLDEFRAVLSREN